MQKRQVFINSAMSVVQTLVTSIVLFVLYRFLMDTIGVRDLGLWSLVLATTSVTQAANMGMTGSVVKFVAKYAARQDAQNVSGIIQTAFVSVAFFIGFVVLVGYPALRALLEHIIPPASVPQALSLLPFALFSLWLTMVSDVFRSGIDGHQKVYVRNLLLIAGILFYFVLCLRLVPAHGLMGLAYAQIFQSLAVLVASWILLKRCAPGLPVLPWKWERRLFREMIGYGVNFQVISIAAMFFDPITKILLSRFGGLTMVGYYEMANKLLLQFRAFVVSANQALVPTIADLKERTPAKIREVYLVCYRLLFYLAVPLYSLIIVSMPAISRLWIGYDAPLFVAFGTLLGVGWFFNILIGPAYVAYLGIGELRWNVLGHITIGLLTIVLGFLGGVFYGGLGVVVGWVLSLILGSAMIMISYHRQYQVPFKELLPVADSGVLLFCLAGVFVGLWAQGKWGEDLGVVRLGLVVFLLFSFFLLPFLWFHPVRRQLTRWIKDLLNMKTCAAK